MKKNKSATTDPINKKHEVEESNDPHIDQDFEGFPHAPAKEELINPKKKEDKLTAKVIKQNNTDEIQSDGSGGAFESTERTEDDDDDRSGIDEK